MIDIRAVTKAYGRTVVVHDVTLTLPRGGVTALVGPNGAGKSTLLSIIARLLEADSGSVLLDDLDVATARSAEVARRLSILRQDNHLAVRLTVRDLVSFGRFPHSKGRLTATDVEHVDRALDHLDLLPLSDRFLDELSGGQRQRAFVAMVLAQDTDFVLLDEPLNNLDMLHAAAIMTILRRAADELGKTIIIVVHDINAAAVYADRIVAMSAGQVVADGTPEQIMDEAVLERVFGLPVTVIEHDGVRLCQHLQRTTTAGSATRAQPHAVRM